MRIVSLVPSATETLRHLGADVVACTRFCEQPDLPEVGGTKNPDLDAVAAFEPDLVVLDRQENRREDADALTDAGLRLFVSDVCSLDDALRVVDDLASVAGVAAPPRPALPAPAAVRGRVFVPIWRRPWMAIGPATYGASLLARLGLDVWTGSADDHYPEVDVTDLGGATLDAILVPSEPYAFGDRHLDELAEAAPGVPVRRVDGQDLFWWGTRTPAALARLAAAVPTSSA